VSYDQSTYIFEFVEYVYVTDDVTITGKGITETGYVTKDFSLSLKTGWNAVYTKETEDDETGKTEQISIGNPPLKWVLWELSLFI
jgi:hypothetical protein